MFEMNAGVKGRFKFIVRKGEELVNETSWSDNLVLDQGLNNLGDKNILQYCRVGTGSSEPIASQTALDNQVGVTSSVPPNPYQNSTGVDTVEGFFWVRKTFRFATGVAQGKLSEVGVGWESDGATLFNRALIRDAKGSRVVVTVLPDETLDVVVEIRTYVSLSPQSNRLKTVVRDPDGSEKDVFYDIKILPYLEPISYQYHLTGQGVNLQFAYGYGQGIQSVTNVPGEYIEEFRNKTNQPYSENRVKTSEIYWGIHEGNGRPLKTVVLQYSMARFQVEMTPGFPKTPQYVLRLEFKLTWSRYE